MRKNKQKTLVRTLKNIPFPNGGWLFVNVPTNCNDVLLSRGAETFSISLRKYFKVKPLIT